MFYEQGADQIRREEARFHRGADRAASAPARPSGRDRHGDRREGPHRRGRGARARGRLLHPLRHRRPGGAADDAAGGQAVPAASGLVDSGGSQGPSAARGGGDAVGAGRPEQGRGLERGGSRRSRRGAGRPAGAAGDRGDDRPPAGGGSDCAAVPDVRPAGRRAALAAGGAGVRSADGAGGRGGREGLGRRRGASRSARASG